MVLPRVLKRYKKAVIQGIVFYFIILPKLFYADHTNNFIFRRFFSKNVLQTDTIFGIIKKSVIVVI